MNSSHPSHWSLRPATEDDFELQWELHRTTMRDYIEQTWGWDDEQQLKFQRERFVPEQMQVIQVDGEDAGLLLVQRRDDAIVLASIKIAPEHQSRGVGSQIIEEILAEAEERGLPVELRVLKVNPARGLYERLGFAVVEETETHYRMRWPSP